MSAGGNSINLRQDVIKINDPSSNSNNFIQNEEDYLSIEMEVKTPFMLNFLVGSLEKYKCLVKDVDDDEDDPGIPINAFLGRPLLSQPDKFMLNKPGLYVVDSREVERITDEYRKKGWHIFCLPSGVTSKDQFCNAIKEVCPLDPPLYDPNWDALADSLWAGFYGIEDKKMVLLWRDACEMKKVSPDEFNIATEILNDLCVSLADPAITASAPKVMIVLQGQ